ncbi:MAG: aa3-type cytochrome c oxidase subunit IV [Hyphomonadaceae bacterium]|nr:aa3-type cytochrome c oxidase subunit IV [Hyphomonadaceae bacterium]
MAAQAHGSGHGGGGEGGMDITEQRQMFHGFLMTSVWGSGLIAQAVALLTLAFAIGAGWWAGLAAFVAIGLAIGLAFKLRVSYWATQIVLIVLLVLGGLIVPAVAGLVG